MGRRGESGGDAASSPHRRSSHRFERRKDGDMGDYSDRHRHRHRDSNVDRDDDSLDGQQHRHRHRHRSSHHHRRGSSERRADVNETMQPERVTRSHRRPRRERDDSEDEYDAFDYDRLSRRRREHRQSEDDVDDRHGRRAKGKRCRDSAAADKDDGRQRSRAYRCEGQQGNEEASRVTGNNAVPMGASDCRAHGDRSQTSNRVAGPSCGASGAVDWSSRRGRQRLPSFAYDMDQQKRFLGFLDRRDASRSRAGAAAMEFTIGADGLVQMPPPPTLVRRQSRHRIGATNNKDGSSVSSCQQHHRKRPPPSCAAPTANTDGEHGDDNSSVASHESLYHDPAAVQVGILPDIVPPSNLYRVALCGVDLSLTAPHLSSMVTQLLGGRVKPWRVRRPAREMLHAAAAYNHTAQQHPPRQQPLTSHKSTVTGSPLVPCAVLAEEPAGAASPTGVIAGPSASVSNTPHAVGSGGGCVLPEAGDSHATSGVLGYGDEKTSGILQDIAGGQQMHMKAEESEGILPCASSLPPPPQPAAPAFYLHGLHDANGPGGMVVLEFSEQTHACRAVQLLNGAYINGRRVAASM
ncbi:hypothetical protein LSCM1_00859 [Leishmania martiniquensis]|uniref:Uncharacterized protein n=1 Tax=Leishmania martiniquensis TaxID=1580590 RepID=A0A836G757_9TRYP|nr:hypothetical protein LSCM1_00859 [Leishmania martiniquensis]